MSVPNRSKSWVRCLRDTEIPFVGDIRAKANQEARRLSVASQNSFSNGHRSVE